MQMVFQDSYASLNPRLPVAMSIAFGPFVHGLAEAGRAEARDASCWQAVGLDPLLFANRYPHELSGGQRQRINIARALALEPRIVILDEAVSALDKSVEAQVLNLLVDLKAQFDLTYVFICHDLNVVRYISDRVLVMYLGKVVEIGPVDRHLPRPAAPLHAGAAVGDAVDGPAPAHDAGAAERRSAQPDQSALGLPLPHALPVRGRRVRSGAAGIAGAAGRWAARGRLPHARARLRPQPRRRRRCQRMTRGGASRAGEPAVSVENLHVRFVMRDATVAAVNGVSFELEAGQVLGILGESGSGKSVTLRALMRLLPPARTRIEGRIRVAGHEITAMDEAALREVRGAKVAMIFQEPMTALDPVFTIGEQIAETIVRHEGVSYARRQPARARAAGDGADPVGGPAARKPIRTRCPAACGSGR